ncbi:MAG: hypothetical protein ACK55Z_35540, partial [bacterium]
LHSVDEVAADRQAAARQRRGIELERRARIAGPLRIELELGPLAAVRRVLDLHELLVRLAHAWQVPLARSRVVVVAAQVRPHFCLCDAVFGLVLLGLGVRGLARL